MRRFLSFIGFGLLVFGSWVPAAEPGTDLDAIIRQENAWLVQTRRHLHRHPELSNREFATGKYLAEQLRAMGMDEVVTGIAGTGVLGILRGRSPRPVIAVRADMDALPVDEPAGIPFRSQNPGVMHACGHDVHMTVALGTARTLIRWRDRGGSWPGTVIFLFQPAEEGPPPGEKGGAEEVVREGVLKKYHIGAILGLHSSPFHPAGVIGYARGPLLASADRFEILVKGKQTHGAFPHQGIDPIYLGAQIVTMLQSIVSRRVDPRDPVVISVGVFEAGRRFNIIPAVARLEGTVRTLNPKTRKQVPVWMENLVRGVTEAHGAAYEFHYDWGPPVTVNDAALVDELLPAAVEALGQDRVQPVEPVMGAEDFAFYAREIPGFYFWLGVRPPDQIAITPLHTPEFTADERSLAVGVQVMTRMVLKYLNDHAGDSGSMGPSPQPGSASGGAESPTDSGWGWGLPR